MERVPSTSAEQTPSNTEDGYLRQALGGILPTALAAVVTSHPADPIGFLSGCLRNYRIRNPLQNTSEEACEGDAQSDPSRERRENVISKGTAVKDKLRERDYPPVNDQRSWLRSLSETTLGRSLNKVLGNRESSSESLDSSHSESSHALTNGIQTVSTSAHRTHQPIHYVHKDCLHFHYDIGDIFDDDDML